MKCEMCAGEHKGLEVEVKVKETGEILLTLCDVCVMFEIARPLNVGSWQSRIK